MESEYLKCLKNEEKKGFTIFTKSMKDLATHFRCVKEHKQPNIHEDDTYAPRPSNKIITEVATKMIYGVGELRTQNRSESCRVVPASLGGFFQIRRSKPKRKQKNV